MKMTASLLALACAATLPLAPVAHAATPESATTVSAAQSQTILEVSASGKLSEIGAAVLGPDVRLTVRLHGPIAFDVDTANFASLEIYADDAAATLTVSEPTAYDRLTAVSLPKANGASAAATTFATAAATSAGVATLAEGDINTGNIVIDAAYVTAASDASIEGVRVDGSINTVTWTQIPSDFTDITIAEGYTLVLACDVSKENWPSGKYIRTATQRSDKSSPAVGATLVLSTSQTIGCSTGDFINRAFDNSATGRFCGTLVLDDGVTLDMTETRGGKIGYLTGIDVRSGATLRLSGGTSTANTNGQDTFKFLEGIKIAGTGTVDAEGISQGALQFAHESGGYLWTDVTLTADATVNVTQPMNPTALSDVEWICGSYELAVTGGSPLNFGEYGTLNIGSGSVTGNFDGGSATVAGGSLKAPIRLPAVITATDMNPITFVGSGVVAGACVFTGNVSIAESLTLQVSATGSSLWTIDGALTVTEGQTLTVGFESAEMTITEPRNIISATEVTGTVSLAAELPEGVKLTPVENGNRVAIWLTGSGTIRPADELSGSVNWSTLKQELVDNNGSLANLTEASSLVLTFASEAPEGSSLTIDETLSLGSLAVNNKSANPVSITLGTNGSLTVANQVTVAAGEVSLPIGTLFDTTTAADTASNAAPADKPAFVVAAGAIATLMGTSGTKYIRKEPISGGGTVVKSADIARLDLYGQDGQINLDGVTLRLEGGALKLVASGNNGGVNSRLRNATVIYAGEEPKLYMFGWCRLDGTVTFVANTDVTTSFNNDNATSFFAVDNSSSTLVLKKGEEASAAGVSLPRVVLAENVGVNVESGTALIRMNTAANRMVTVCDDTVLRLESAGNTNGAKIKVCTGGTIKPESAPTSCQVDLEFEDGAIFDRSVGAIDIGGKSLVLPESGTVTVRVAADMTGWDTSYLIKTTSTGVLNADNAKKFAIGSNMGLPIADHFIVHKSEGFGFGTVVGTVPSAGSILGALLRDAAIENGSASAMVVCGGTLTADKAEAGVERFTHVTTTATDSGTTTITVAYDFGVSKMAIREIDGTRYVIVGAKVQGAEGATTAADFADTTEVQVSVNDEVKTATEVTDETGTTEGQSTEAGVKWFRLPYADVVGTDTGTFSLTVKALPQTP